MTKTPETVVASNTMDVLEWVNSQPGLIPNSQVYETFPQLEPNNIRVILHRYHRKGLIDKPGYGVWAPKGYAQFKRPRRVYPVLKLTPGTKIHRVYEALREFEGPVTVFQLSRATGLPRHSLSTHLCRLKSGNLVSNPSRGVWVFNS